MLVSAVLLWLPACVPWVVAMKLEPGEKPELTPPPSWAEFVAGLVGGRG